MDDNEKKSQAAVVSTISAASSIVKPSVGNNLNQSQAEVSKLQSDQNSNVKKLVDSLRSLSDTMKIGFKSKPKDTKDGGESVSGAISGVLKDLVKGKTTGAKQLLTKEGLLSGLAGMTGGGLTSTILGSAAERIKESKEQQSTKEEWKKTFLSSTEVGKELSTSMSKEDAQKEAEKLYNEKLKLEKEISELEDKQKKIKSSGVEGADISTEEKRSLIEKKETISSMAVKRLMPQLALPAPEQQLALPAPPTSAPETTASDLVKVSENQLEELKKLVKSATVSEEDRLEAAAANKQTPDLLPKIEKEKEEEKKGFMEGLLGLTSFKDSLGSVIKGFTSVLPVLGMAAQGMAVGAAAFAGFKAGEWLNEKVLNPFAEMVTGEKGATLGTAAYDGVDKVKGMLGFQTDADKEKEAVKKYITEKHAKDMAAGAVSPYLAKEAEKYGIKTPQEIIKAPTAQSIPRAQEIIKAPTAQSIPRAQEQTSRMEARTAEVIDKKTEQKPIIIQAPAPAPAIVPSVTQTNTTIVRPDTRSAEPTFNRILSNNFNHK